MPEKFIVPQFIDKEDQILGSIVVRQFLIMLVAAFLVFIVYKLLTFPYFIAATIGIVAMAGTFGFLKVNSQPFHVFFVNFLQTSVRPSLRTWDKHPTDAELREWMKAGQITPPTQVSAAKPHPESSRLRDLSLIVNTGGVYRPDEEI